MGSHKKITRLDFLKRSGLMAAGFTFLPHALLASESDEVRAAKLAAYQIVVPDQPSAIEQQAAEKMQHYLAEMVHTTPSTTKEKDYHAGPSFFIGQTRYAAARKIDVKALKEDGFVLQPVGKNLVIVGGTGKGTLYGVYGLLELSGFRMYTSKAIQTGSAIRIPKSPLVVVPTVQYRTTSYPDTHDPEYTEWHRLSSRSDWGLFVHTFNELVPPDKYGKTHPEYFSLINGTRLPGTQLCLSNREMLAVLVASLKEKIAAKPTATYWSVSQNDNDQYCRCGPCTELNTKYGNVPSGSILYFVNEVARAIPGKTISTLAYWYSRTPPKNIQAEPNVNIMLCNIESRRQGPVYETDPAFSRDLIEWGKISGNILIWDYNIQFANLMSPFPNLHTIKPNIKFYTDHHVNSLYMQSNGQTGGEMAGLRAYLICKLMWNPEADDSALIDEFLNGYYGDAGRPIRQYIDSMRVALIASGLKLNIFGSPEDAKDAYLSVDNLKVYSGQFDQAEKAVANNPQLLTRVKIARLPIQYAVVQIGRNEIDTPRSMFAHTPDGKVFVKPEMKTYVQQIVDGCKLDGVSKLRERSTPPDDYLAAYQRVFTNVEATQHSLSFAKKIAPVTLPEGGPDASQRLTDGLFGCWESWSAPDVNWVAYKGQHIDFVLDLDAVRDVRSIQMDFLNAQAQPDWNLLVLPAYVSYATSVDGKTFSPEVKVTNPHNPNPKENPDIAKVAFQPFRAEVNAKARYIKVHAESMLHMPSWHIRAGQPATLSTDQIVVV